MDVPEVSLSMQYIVYQRYTNILINNETNKNPSKMK